MVIISSYLDGESYGLLGPQLAASVIRALTGWPCIVIGVTRRDDPADLKAALDAYIDGHRPIVGFSLLSGREDLFALAAELKAAGAVTLLGGPQAAVDFCGESGWRTHPGRFAGLAAAFSAAVQGPAEQVAAQLPELAAGRPPRGPGWLATVDGRVRRQQPQAWDPRHLGGVDWGNLYRLTDGALAPVTVSAAQVLQQIGCPYAAAGRRVPIDYPAGLATEAAPPIVLDIQGCSFCDVAADKGFFGTLPDSVVLEQIAALPTGPDGRRIPFELINENPLPGLARLLAAAADRGLRLSRIDLTLRADWLVRHADALRRALRLAHRRGTVIVAASIGFESFDATILRNLNKGLDVQTNLAAVGLLRRLKRDFPDTWGYRRAEGGRHGFIHPTPWDTDRTQANLDAVIARHGLDDDILPDHSIPLIIHHASHLGDWIRAVEKARGVRFGRRGPIVEWWERSP